MFHTWTIYALITANQLTGAYEGQPAKLECHTEAFPKSINYWTGEKGQSIIASSSGELIYERKYDFIKLEWIHWGQR